MHEAWNFALGICCRGPGVDKQTNKCNEELLLPRLTCVHRVYNVCVHTIYIFIEREPFLLTGKK